MRGLCMSTSRLFGVGRHRRCLFSLEVVEPTGRRRYRSKVNHSICNSFVSKRFGGGSCYPPFEAFSQLGRRTRSYSAISSLETTSRYSSSLVRCGRTVCKDVVSMTITDDVDTTIAGGTGGAKGHLPPQLMSVAPMMDWTDVHFRQLARLMSRNVWLYTEMVVDSTLIFNPDHDRFLWFPPEQHPLVCQLGGSEPDKLAKASVAVAKYGYDEINLNCGCPSDRVAGAGCFGAALMLQPESVAECCRAVAEATKATPITVKCRLGVDDVDSYEALHRFVSIVSTQSPVKHFMIHARKCLLKGLSPHQNRTIPPLRYHWVWALKRDFPHLDISLNGGVVTLEEVAAVLRFHERVDPGVGSLTGVMVGRAAYNDPWRILGNADVAIWGEASNPCANRRELLDRYAEYADSVVGKWGSRKDGHCHPSVRCLVKPLMGLFYCEPKGKQWRAAVDSALRDAKSVREVLDRTIHVLRPETLDAPPYPLDESKISECNIRNLLNDRYVEPLPSLTNTTDDNAKGAPELPPGKREILRENEDQHCATGRKRSKAQDTSCCIG